MSVTSTDSRQVLNPKSTSILLAIGLTLGLAGDVFIGGVITPGPGLALWVALFGLAASGLAVHMKHPSSHVVMGWSVLAFVAALMLVFRLTPVVILAMGMVMATTAAMALLELQGIPALKATVMNHIRAILQVPLQALAGIVPLMGQIDVREGTHHPRFLAVLRGLFIALPLLLVFGALFSEADASFEALAQRLLSGFSPELSQHLIIILLFTWAGTGLLAALYGSPVLWRKHNATALFRLGAEETMIIMGALCLLFITFVILQLPYLFGGRETLEANADLTLAQYARRGFFELVAVAGLTLGVLLILAKTAVPFRVFTPLAAVLLACALIILVSALQRLVLYTQEFGLTLSRVTAFVAMLWIAVCLVLFGLIILRGRKRGFALGMTCSAMTLAFLFAAANPVVLVAKANTSDTLLAKRPLDSQYLMHLGAAAIPTMLHNLTRFDSNDRCLLAINLLYAKENSHGAGSHLERLDDWRTWNLVSSRMLQAINVHEEELARISERCVNN